MCASFGGLIIYYHFPFFHFHFQIARKAFDSVIFIEAIQPEKTNATELFQENLVNVSLNEFGLDYNGSEVRYKIDH